MMISKSFSEENNFEHDKKISTKHLNYMIESYFSIEVEQVFDKVHEDKK